MALRQGFSLYVVVESPSVEVGDIFIWFVSGRVSPLWPADNEIVCRPYCSHTHDGV